MKLSRATTIRLLVVGLVMAALILSTQLPPSSPIAGMSGVSYPSHLQSLRGEPDSQSIHIPGKEAPTQSLAAFEQEQRAFPGGIPADGYPLGMRQANRLSFTNAPVAWQQLGPLSAPDAGSANPLTGKRLPISGRATALAVVPSTCSTDGCDMMYLGSADGGVWKTTDGGRTWKPLLDHARSLAVGTVVLDPKDPNIVYVGTGEPNHSGDSFRGIGILRSTDGGSTWTNLGYKQFVNRAVAAIVIDPRTAGTTHATLYAVSTRAASGGAMTGGGSSRRVPGLPGLGFYYSKDGGQTWKESSPAPSGAQSLVMDPSNPDVLYAGFNPDVGDPNNTGSPQAQFGLNGVFKTTDDGLNWLKLTNGLPQTDFDSIQLAIAPSNPRIVYAAYQLTAPDSPFSAGAFGGPSHLSLYKSTDGGATWTALTNTPSACGDQCEYDMPLAIDPNNSSVLYIGGTANYNYWDGNKPVCATLDPLSQPCHATVMRTSDGGNTWADLSENGIGGPLHPDDHAIVLDPKNPNVVYTVNDGGIFRSLDSGQTWVDLNRGLGTLQFNGLAVASDGAIYAGTQDNGTFKYTGSTTWTHIQDGDGGPSSADPSNPQLVYKSYFGPLLVRNDHGGDPKYDVFIASFWGDQFVKGLGQFYEPYQIAPSGPQTIYFGTYRIWRSNLRGGTDGNNDGDVTNDPSDKTDWVPISFDLRCSDQPVDPASTCTGGPYFGKGIASLAVSPVNPNVVVAGASNGNIWITRNALARVQTDASCSPLLNVLQVALCDDVSGPTWHRIDTGLPKRYPTSIKFAAGSSTKLYVTFSGFDQNTPRQKGHVFMSLNAGRTWKNLDGSGKSSTLPNLPFSDIIINPANGHLYASADYGVYASFNQGHGWQRIDQSMPYAPIDQMQFFAERHQLLVATHGRGIWAAVAP